MANQTERLQWMADSMDQVDIMGTLPWVLIGLFSLWLIVPLITNKKKKVETERRIQRKKKLELENKLALKSKLQPRSLRRSR